MNWKDELQSNLTEAKALEKYLQLSVLEKQRLEVILEQFPMTITQYYLSLINWEDPNDPIRRMCIPSMEELNMTGCFDTSGESSNTILPGLQHKYRETALILSTHRCAMYCRHCFRKRLVGISEKETAANINEMADYIQMHPEISNVLISGGDSFLNSNTILQRYLELFCAIGHLDLIRFGTRTPVVLPTRISEDPDLLSMLAYYNHRKKIYVITQFNHPSEFTFQARKAVDALLNAGICLKNQAVLLKGVNDDCETLGLLLKKLTSWGIIPYYIFQCRPVSGVGGHFQVPLSKGYQIVEGAKQLQNGQGKCFRYVMSHTSGKIEMLGEMSDNEMLFKYHQAKNPDDSGRIFVQKLTSQQTWLAD